VERLLETQTEVTILDLVGAGANGSYRSIFDVPNVRYLAADPIENLDIAYVEIG
jgi:hypothetical protein